MKLLTQTKKLWVVGKKIKNGISQVDIMIDELNKNFYLKCYSALM